MKDIFFRLLALCGQDRRFLKRISAHQSLVILNLHKVSPQHNPFWSPLHPRLFDDLLTFLKCHFNVISFSDLARASQTLGKPNAIISFDDGYYDFVEYAMPILERHKLKANMNIIPQCVESGRPSWNIQLYDFLNVAPRQLINELRLPGFDICLKDDDDQSKIKFGLHISRFLKNRPAASRLELWSLIEPVLQKQQEFEMTRMMRVKDVLEAAAYHEIGAHSYSHESMGFEEEAFFRADLQQCKSYFHEKLQLPLTIYAFPNGSYQAKYVDILSEEGIEHILLVDENFSCIQRRVHPRLTLSGSSSLELRFQALGYRRKAGLPLCQ